MRISVQLTAFALIILMLAGGVSISSAERVIAPTEAAPAHPPVVFSSRYTSLSRCPSGLTKKEEREAEKHGSDIPNRCAGLGGYHVDISYSACASNIAVTKGDDSISLGMQTVNYTQKTLEWRLANGKPFAVIMRSYEYSGGDLCTTNGKIVSESLVVKGLVGFEHIDEEVQVKGTPSPNVKARELADKGYAKSKS